MTKITDAAQIPTLPPLTMPLEEAMIASEGREVDLVALDEALERLAAIDPQQSRVVELKFFSGMSVEETAEDAGNFTKDGET